jgi:hypothetical protein
MSSPRQELCRTCGLDLAQPGRTTCASCSFMPDSTLHMLALALALGVAFVGALWIWFGLIGGGVAS